VEIVATSYNTRSLLLEGKKAEFKTNPESDAIRIPKGFLN